MIVLLMSLNSNAIAFDHQHKAFDLLLKKAVFKTGATTQVDYLALRQDRSGLEAYLRTLSAVKRVDLEKWNQNEQLAFWINAYNAFTLKVIIDHHSPDKKLRSIRKIGSLFRNTWNLSFFKMLGEDFTLDRIEKKEIIGGFNEARIHFAVNCASIGCPALSRDAYSAPALNDQLELAATGFLSDRTRNLYNLKKKKLCVSKIFDWYEKDFVRDACYGSVKKFVAPRISDDPNVQAALLRDDIEVDFTDYNWNLNEKGHTAPEIPDCD